VFDKEELSLWILLFVIIKEVFVMKQILTFIVVTLVSGCNGVISDFGDIVAPPPIKPLSSYNVVERGYPESPKKALVIGNKEYQYSDLRNPVNDANSMTAQLEKMGFDITLATNLNYRSMENVVQKFGKHLSQTPGDVAFFYFSGHGAQVNGQNFLIPTDNYNIRGERDLEQNAIPAETILAMMEKENQGMNILVLDACRDNPYRGSEKNLTRGLAQIQAPRGAVVAFATATGETALDGDGNHGLYTGYLLDALDNSKHLRIEDVFMKVRNFVYDATHGKQEPWYQASLRTPFCFGGCKSH
jgi:uncharacterized caspase-like protein